MLVLQIHWTSIITDDGEHVVAEAVSPAIHMYHILYSSSPEGEWRRRRSSNESQLSIGFVMRMNRAELLTPTRYGRRRRVVGRCCQVEIQWSKQASIQSIMSVSSAAAPSFAYFPG